MIAITVWILELLLMGTIAYTNPDALLYDNMIGGMVFSALAWIPAMMLEVLWE